MPANLENAAMMIGLEKFSSHFNLKEEQFQELFKLPHKCAHLACYQGNAQNPVSWASYM